MPQRIPISAARRVAEDHCCRQVILVAWDGELVHVVTYGKSTADADQAAQGGNAIKKSLGWPDALCASEPSRVQRLRRQIADLKRELKEARDLYEANHG